MTRDLSEHMLVVTVSFVVKVTNLAEYGATNSEEAAENLQRWYADGSADFVQDFEASLHKMVCVSPCQFSEPSDFNDEITH